MKKRLFVLVTMIALMLVTSGLVHAKHFIPASTTACSASFDFCTSVSDWNSGVSIHGAATTVEVSNPSVSGSDFYDKFMQFGHTGSYPEYTMSVGQGVNLAGCGSGDYYYFDYSDTSTSIHVTKCFPVPSGDVNNFTTFKSSYFVSNGGGFFIWITNSHGTNYCTPTPCTYSTVSDSNATTPANDNQLDQEYKKSSFSGHAVWGVEFDDNQFFTTSWGYDATTSIITNKNINGQVPPNNPPPQMYWNPAPNGSNNNGGNLHACEYDSGTTCITGS